MPADSGCAIATVWKIMHNKPASPQNQVRKVMGKCTGKCGIILAFLQCHLTSLQKNQETGRLKAPLVSCIAGVGPDDPLDPFQLFNSIIL